MKLWIKALIFAGAIALVIIAANLAGLGKYMSLENISRYGETLTGFIRDYYAASVAAYIVLYFLTEALSLPVATILTLAGGFLFGWLPAILYVNIGATAGACGIFILTRYFIGKSVQVKYAQALTRFNAEIEENGVSYFLILRLVPLFPFFMVNLFAGLTKVSFARFLWTTSLGIIPGSAVYTYAGASITSIHKLGDVLSIKVIGALLFLALLSAVPLIYKKIAGKKRKENKHEG